MMEPGGEPAQGRGRWVWMAVWERAAVGRALRDALLWESLQVGFTFGGIQGKAELCQSHDRARGAR